MWDRHRRRCCLRHRRCRKWQEIRSDASCCARSEGAKQCQHLKQPQVSVCTALSGNVSRLCKTNHAVTAEVQAERQYLLCVTDMVASSELGEASLQERSGHVHAQREAGKAT